MLGYSSAGNPVFNVVRSQPRNRSHHAGLEPSAVRSVHLRPIGTSVTPATEPGSIFIIQ